MKLTWNNVLMLFISYFREKERYDRQDWDEGLSNKQIAKALGCQEMGSEVSQLTRIMANAGELERLPKQEGSMTVRYKLPSFNQPND